MKRMLVTVYNSGYTAPLLCTSAQGCSKKITFLAHDTSTGTNAALDVRKPLLRGIIQVGSILVSTCLFGSGIESLLLYEESLVVSRVHNEGGAFVALLFSILFEGRKFFIFCLEKSTAFSFPAT